jgi:hypothetical protein
MLAQCDQDRSTRLSSFGPWGIRIDLGPLLWTPSGEGVGPSLEVAVWIFLLVGSGHLPVDGSGETVGIVACKRARDSEATTRQL